jgi:hypothetical protein
VTAPVLPRGQQPGALTGEVLLRGERGGRLGGGGLAVEAVARWQWEEAPGPASRASRCASACSFGPPWGGTTAEAMATRRTRPPCPASSGRLRSTRHPPARP